MVFTEQQIKQIILQEQEIYLKENILKKLINKFFNKPKNDSVDDYVKRLQMRYSIDPEVTKQTKDAYNLINSLILQGMDPKQARSYVLKKAVEDMKKEYNLGDESETSPPPAPPQDKEEPEAVGTEDFVLNAKEIYKNVSKKAKVNEQEVENLINFLRSKNLLKPEVISKLGLSESLVKKVFNKIEGNKKMKLTEKVVKKLIKEEVSKNKLAKEGMLGRITGGKEGSLNQDVKNNVEKIAKETNNLKDQINDIIKRASELNLQPSNSLKALQDKINGSQQLSLTINKDIKSKKPVLVPKGSIQTGASSSNPQTTNTGPNTSATDSTSSTVGGTQKVGGTDVADISPAAERAEAEKIRSGEGGAKGSVTQATGPSGDTDKQQTRKDKASQMAQSANKNQTQSPEVKNLQSIINSVRNPAKGTNTIMVSKPILARLGAAGFTPQQSKKVVELFRTFLTDKVKKTSKGAQITITEQQQAQTGHNNLRVFDNSSRSVMGNLIKIMKQVLQDQSLGKPTKQINDTIVANLAKELAKDIANQARVSAGLTIDAKSSTAQPAAPAGVTGAPPPAASAATPATPAATPPATSAEPAATSAEPAATSEKEGKKEIKKFTQANTGVGKYFDDLMNQEEFKQLGIQPQRAQDILRDLGLGEISAILAENKLNENLIPRKKASLSEQEIKRIKLLAGIIK